MNKWTVCSKCGEYIDDYGRCGCDYNPQKVRSRLLILLLTSLFLFSLFGFSGVAKAKASETVDLLITGSNVQLVRCDVRGEFTITNNATGAIHRVTEVDGGGNAVCVEGTVIFPSDTKNSFSSLSAQGTVIVRLTSGTETHMLFLGAILTG